MKYQTHCGIALALAAVAAMACDDRRTAPTGVAPALVGVAIAGLPAEVTVGDSLQLRASATWNDNRSEDVTTKARWGSKTLVCVVTPAGLVRALEPGECLVSASYEAATTVATAAVRRSSVLTLSGVVRERFESGEPPIPGAIVTVKSGPETNRRLVADERGQYALERMPMEPVVVEFAAAGFESEPVTLIPENPTRDVLLTPQDELIEWRDRPGLSGRSVTIPFEVTHRGPFTLSARSTLFECGTYETYGTFIRRIDKVQYIAGVIPCSPGVTSSVDGYVERGRYELVAWTQFGLGGSARSASLTHPQ